MSVSNLSFLDKDNYCYACAKKLDNKRMEEIILEAARHACEDYYPTISTDDPVIISEDMQFCSYSHYFAWLAKEEEKTPLELRAQQHAEFERWWKNFYGDQTKK